MNTYFVKMFRVHVLPWICASGLFFNFASFQHAYECCHYSNLHSCVPSINCRKKIIEVDLKTFG